MFYCMVGKQLCRGTGSDLGLGLGIRKLECECTSKRTTVYWVKKKVDEMTDESVLRWFCHIELEIIGLLKK